MIASPPPNNDSLSPHATSLLSQWSSNFMNTIYQVNGAVNSGFPIDNESVLHIRQTVITILSGLLELKATSLLELDKKGEKIFPPSGDYMRKEALERVEKYAPTLKKNKFSFSKPHHPQTLMFSIVKECYPSRDKEKKDREREREIDRMALYLNSLCEIVVEDILKWTGNYVSNLRTRECKISIQNLKIAMSSDKVLLDLTSFSTNEEEDTPGNGFLDQICDLNDNEDIDELTNTTYDSIAREFLKDERLYFRQLKQLDACRKRLYEYCDDRNLLRMLFGNFADLYELTTKMERLLEDSLEMSDTPCIGFCVWELCEACDFDSYISYAVRGLDDEPERPFTIAVERSIEELFDSKHKRIFERGTDKIDGETFRLIVRHVLPSLLQAPLIHFYHYLEYVSKLLDANGIGEDKTELQYSKRYLLTVGNKIQRLIGDALDLKSLVTQDQEARRMSHISLVTRLHQIESGIDGFNGNPIGKSCLELVKDGILLMVRPSYSGGLDTPTKGRWSTSRYIYLFDQELILTKKHNKSLKYKDRGATQLMRVVEVDDNAVFANGFRLVLSEKGNSNIRNYTFVCKTNEEKASWLKALLRTSTKSAIERQVVADEEEDLRKSPLVLPTPEQYRFSEPDSEDNISYEDYTSNSGMLVVKCATVLKLVEWLTNHKQTDSKFTQTFLISFRSFVSPSDFLDLLIERFNIPLPLKLQQETRGGPLAGRFDTVQSHGLSGANNYSLYCEQSYLRFRKEYERPIQIRVLTVLMQWIKNHWHDFSSDPELLNNTQKFLQQSVETNGKLTNQHKKFCRNILATIDKQLARNNQDGHVNTAFDFDEGAMRNFDEAKPEVLWHTAKQGDISNYDLLTLHPVEIGRQLTLLHFDLYRAVKPIELVDAAWMKRDKYVKSPQLLKLTAHTNLLTYWVSRSIVDSDSLEERTAMFARVIEVMSVFEELHNFTGFVAFRAALHSAAVHRLDSCWQRLSTDKMKRYDQMESLCDKRWTALQRRIQSINPPCIPFFGQYLTNIQFLQDGNKTFVSSPGATGDPSDMNTISHKSNKKVLVSFLKCRRISDVIREIQMYQNKPYNFQLEPTIRQFFESINPRRDKKDDNDELEDYLFNRSKVVEPKKDQPPLDLKPKHPSHVLKSPGIKLRKPHPSTPSYSTQTSTVPSTPSHDSDGPKSALLTPPGTDMVGQRVADIYDSHGKKPAPFGLLPPPVYPRKNKAPTPPALPPAFSGRKQPLSPPIHTPSRSPASTPNSAKLSNGSGTAFVFPEKTRSIPHPSTPPLKPRRRSVDQGSTFNELVVLPKASVSGMDVNVAEVFPAPAKDRALPPLSCAPPPLPPRMKTSLPPLPPKKKIPCSPPPLPPKSYKHPK